ncbi:hypothetical protein D3C86_2162570 [compost metagenome]
MCSLSLLPERIIPDSIIREIYRHKVAELPDHIAGQDAYGANQSRNETVLINNKSGGSRDYTQNEFALSVTRIT